MKIKPADNSTYKKLAVQWLNEALCFVSSLVVAYSLVLSKPGPNKPQNVSSKNKRQQKPKNQQYEFSRVSTL